MTNLGELYEGNLEELRHIKAEIAQHHVVTAQRAEEYNLLQEHLRFVLALIRDKSRGGL